MGSRKGSRSFFWQQWRTALFIPLLLVSLGVLSSCSVQATASPQALLSQPLPPQPPVPERLPAGDAGPGCITQSNLGKNGNNFEVVVLEGSNLIHFWHDNSLVTSAWHRGQVITDHATGPGCIIQSSLGANHNNFEVVVPEADLQGGQELVHYFHNNADVTSSWQRGQVIAHHITGPGCMIQSKLGVNQNNFEVVVPQSDPLGGQELMHYWHDNSNLASPWQPGQVIARGISGPGCITPSTLNGAYRFEVVVPQPDPQGGQGLVHYWHDNASVTSPWQPGQVVAHAITGPGCIIQSDLGANHNNFEVVVPQADPQGGQELAHYWQENSLPVPFWQPGQVIAHQITGSGCITESTLGALHNNFEVVVPQAGNLVHWWHDNTDVTLPWQQGLVITYNGRSQKVCQLTGEYDQEYEHPTTNQTLTRANIQGTDLGFPVEAAPFGQGGKLYFLFGDTGKYSSDTLQGNYDGNTGEDSIAFTWDTTPPSLNSCIHLQFNTDHTGPGATFVPPVVQPVINQGFFDVPTSGFSANGHLYVFFWTHSDPNCGKAVCCPISHLLGCDTPDDWGSSVLARSDDGGRTFTQVYTVPGSNFIYTATAVVRYPNSPGLPNRPGIFIWGISHYRGSNPHLAFVPLNAIENLQAWQYFEGLDPVTGIPQWSPQDDSTDLFQEPCVGELSVTWNPFLHQWLMLYNCGISSSTGMGQVIRARVAAHPWGPWSASTVIFDPSDGTGPTNDNGFCHFMHQDRNPACEQVGNPAGWPVWGDPKNPGHWGDVYAPYVISRFTTGNATSSTVYFTMSTWNPYEVVIMKATFQLPTL